MKNPFEEMVSLIEQDTKKKLALTAMSLANDLGTITSTGLKLDSFNHEIPKGQYMILDWAVTLEFPAFYFTGTESSPINPDPDNGDNGSTVTSNRTRYDFESRKVIDVHIDLKSSLKPGDRVVCMTAKNGNEVIVVGKVVNS